MAGSTDFDTVVQELEDSRAVPLGTQEIGNSTYEIYRVGVARRELIAINRSTKSVGRGATLEQVAAVIHGGSPVDPPAVPQRPAIVPPNPPTKL